MPTSRKRISALTSRPSALDGTELIELVQNGNSYRGTASDIAGLANGSGFADFAFATFNGEEERTTRIRNRDIVNILEFDVDPNGENSSTDGITAALAQVPNYGKLLFPQGRYAIDGDGVSINRSRITLDGGGVAVLDGSGLQYDDDEAIMTISGTGAGASTTIAADVDPGDATVTVASASGFAVGDWVKLTSTEQFNGVSGVSGYAPMTKGEALQIRYIDGNDITFDADATGVGGAGVQDSYTASGKTITLTKMTLVEDISVTGFAFKGTGHGSSALGASGPTSPRGIRHTYARGLKLRDCRFRDFSRFAIITDHAFDMEVSSCWAQGRDLTTASNAGLTQSPWFTFLYFQCSQGLVFAGNQGWGFRHFLDADSDDDGASILARDILASGNRAFGCASPFAGHSCTDVAYVGNTIVSSGGDAISFRGKNALVAGNKACNISGYLFRCGGISDINYTDNGFTSSGDITVVGNEVTRALGLVQANGDINNLVVSGNTTSSLSDNGITTKSRRIKQQIISNNIIDLSGRDVSDISVAGYYDRNTSGLILERGSIKVTGNTFNSMRHGVIIEGVDRYDAPTSAQTTPANNVDISGNTFKTIVTTDITLSQVDGERGLFGDNVRIRDNILSQTLLSAVVPAFGYVFKAWPDIGGNKCPGEAVYDHWPTSGALDGTEYSSHQTGLTVYPGMKFDIDTPAAGGPLGYVALTTGTMGSSSKTGSITSGTATLTTTTASAFEPGTYINIPTAGPAAATKKARVVSLSANRLVATIDSNASSTATAQAVNYANPTMAQIVGIGSESQQLITPVCGNAKVGATAGWVITAGTDKYHATLPAGQTASTLIVPINGLRVGDLVTAVSVVGQVESAGNNVTLTMDVRKLTASSAADLTDASLDTDNVGTLVADTLLTDANGNLKVTALTETMAASEQLYVVLTGTTAAATDIDIMAIVATITAAD